MTKTALYRIWDGENLLYVGISKAPWLRLYSHSRGKDWAFFATRVEVEWFDSRCAALDAERKAIDAELPSKNKFDPIGAIKEKADTKKNALADWISRSGMTQAKFAELCGIHFTAMSRITSGTRQPSYEGALRIERATGGKIKASFWSVRKLKTESKCNVLEFNKLFCKGLKAKEIAKIMNVSEPVVRSIARAQGVDWKHLTKKLKRKSEIIRMCKDGYTTCQAAHEMGIKQSTMSRYAKIFGVKFADGRKLNLESKGKKKAKNRLDIERLADMGLTVTQTARELELHQAYVSRIKSEFNIQFTSVKSRLLPENFKGLGA
jgi:predicted transcriptional regulator/predicted GIY-YIG superfamily endonuclease